MPKNDYEAGVPIEFTYRCSQNHATADPVATILDETGAVFTTLTVGTGIVHKHGKTFLVTFTPDEIGTWIANVTDDNGGDVSKSFSVATHGLPWVVSQINAMVAAVAALTAAVQAIQVDTDGGGAHIG